MKNEKFPLGYTGIIVIIMLIVGFYESIKRGMLR
jgi:hypothetical protein